MYSTIWTDDNKVSVQDLLSVLASFGCTIEVFGRPCGQDLEEAPPVAVLGYRLLETKHTNSSLTTAGAYTLVLAMFTLALAS